MARATCTTIVITNAWIAMVTKLTPPPTKNCRNIFAPARLLDWQEANSRPMRYP
jgi:hypothetical protein